MFCGICGSPLYYGEHAGAWFHDVYPRSLATICREPTEHPFATTGRSVNPDRMPPRPTVSLPLERLP